MTRGYKMKKQKQHDPFINLVLDDEEKLLEQAFKKGEFKKIKIIVGIKSIGLIFIIWLAIRLCAGFISEVNTHSKFLAIVSISLFAIANGLLVTNILFFLIYIVSKAVELFRYRIFKNS